MRVWSHLSGRRKLVLLMTFGGSSVLLMAGAAVMIHERSRSWWLPLMLLTGTLVVTVALTVRLQRLMAEPLLEVAQAVRKAAAGSDDVRLALPESRAEISDLTADISRMLTEMHARNEALQARNQELEAEIDWRCRYEDMLRESEERYRAFVTHSSEAVWRIELEEPVPVGLTADEQIELFYRVGWLAECNEAMARMYGSGSAAEMIGVRLDSLLLRDDPRNAEYLRSFIQADYRLTDAESVEQDQAGKLRYMLNNLTGVIENNCVVRVWGTQRDITARRSAAEALRESRNKYSLLFNQLPDPVFIFDRVTHRLLDFNDSVLRIYGYSADELRAMTPFDLHPPEEHDYVAGKIDVVNLEQPFTYTHLTRAGRRMAVEILSNQIVYEGHQAMISLVRDITERREAQAKLLEFTEQLKASNRELEDFASVASHDLQEPLRKVQAFGDRLKAKYYDNLGAEGRDYLTRMQNAAGRMQTLINDLLMFSRVNTRAQPFRPTDLARVVRDVLSDLETRIEQTGGRVETGTLPVIDADPVQMGQLLQNLIGNALKFHQPGQPPVVQITARLISQPEMTSTGYVPRPRTGDLQQGGWCELVVADEGIGFDEKYLDRIFTIFQRLQGREQYEGTGVGLAVCRRIAERHGGTITASSRPGAGARFIVTLPVRQAAVTSEQMNAAGASH